MRFRARVESHGKTATGIRVPDQLVADLAAGKRPKVAVTINGYRYRTSVAPMGGQFLVGVSAEVRAGAGVAAGDEVDVDIELDTAPREVAVPADLAEALAGDNEVARFFAGLSYSHQRAYVTWIESAKKDETRRRRVAQAVVKLRDGRVQA
jgi:hypothetical protein